MKSGEVDVAWKYGFECDEFKIVHLLTIQSAIKIIFLNDLRYEAG